MAVNHGETFVHCKSSYDRQSERSVRSSVCVQFYNYDCIDREGEREREVISDDYSVISSSDLARVFLFWRTRKRKTTELSAFTTTSGEREGKSEFKRLRELNVDRYLSKEKERDTERNPPVKNCIALPVWKRRSESAQWLVNCSPGSRRQNSIRVPLKFIDPEAEQTGDTINIEEWRVEDESSSSLRFLHLLTLSIILIYRLLVLWIKFLRLFLKFRKSVCSDGVDQQKRVMIR